MCGWKAYTSEASAKCVGVMVVVAYEGMGYSDRGRRPSWFMVIVFVLVCGLSVSKSVNVSTYLCVHST